MQYWFEQKHSKDSERREKEGNLIEEGYDDGLNSSLDNSP